ncbi:hypothetical protein KCMC57_up01250 [Kitasatospora sp. CMC57]|uniref:Uncharacterized protein n=1 Tax=Kitasatospora sp. CMC57 TaxID=3231513 RepID=A0AB33JWL4_9ACTN
MNASPAALPAELPTALVDLVIPAAVQASANAFDVYWVDSSGRRNTSVSEATTLPRRRVALAERFAGDPIQAHVGELLGWVRGRLDQEDFAARALEVLLGGCAAVLSLGIELRAIARPQDGFAERAHLQAALPDGARVHCSAPTLRLRAPRRVRARSVSRRTSVGDSGSRADGGEAGPARLTR